MKTPEQMATDWYIRLLKEEPAVAIKEAYQAGYKAGFEIGCMKGSMAMQWTLDDDYHFTPTIDHEKLANVMTKKEIENE